MPTDKEPDAIGKVQQMVRQQLHIANEGEVNEYNRGASDALISLCLFLDSLSIGEDHHG